MASQMLFMGAGSILLSFNSLVGHELAPNMSLSTLPHAMLSLGSAVVTIPISLLMYRFGRRFGFMLGATAGAIGGLLAAVGAALGSFPLFCAGTTLYGGFQASGQYYRFAAAESVQSKYRNTIVSIVIGCSVVGILVGPWIGGFVGQLGSVSTYVGNYLAVGLMASLALVAAFLGDPFFIAPESGRRKNDSPLLSGTWHHSTLVAITNSVVGFAVMVAIMVASPLAVVDSGHSIVHSTALIQLHLVGMYLPSVITGKLADRFGSGRMMLIGLCLLSASAAISLSSASMYSMAATLFLLGVGWNFTYMGSTAVLAALPDPADRVRAQGINEFLVSVVVTFGILGAGFAYGHGGWRLVNLFAIAMLSIALALTVQLLLRPRAEDRLKPTTP